MKKLSSLRFKLPFIISGTNSIMIAILLIVVVNIGTKAISKTAKDGFLNAAAGYASFIDMSIQAQSLAIDGYSALEIVIDYAKNVNNTPEKTQSLKKIIKKMTVYNPYMVNIYILTVDGKCIFAENDNTSNANDLFKTHPAAYEGLLKSGYNIGYDDTVYISQTTGNSAILFMCGIKDIYTDGKTVGVLAVVLDVGMLIRDTIQNQEIGKTGQVFAIDKNGNYAINKNVSLVMSQANESQRQAYSIGKGSLDYVDKNTKHTMAFTKLKTQPWIIGVTMEQGELYASSRLLTTIGIAIGVITMFVLLIVIILFTKTITVPLGESVKHANMIANGNLTYKASKTKERKDEIGELSNAFNVMQEQLKDIIVKVNDSVIQMKSAINEVAQGSTDLSHRTESQAASLEETASSMEQMASTIKASAENTVHGNEMMSQSKEAAINAASIIEATTLSIEEVLEASSKISAITKMIENIALQTNILALNAAVEAARAGEQGRGFAVVASEVRSLAQTTQTSVKDITNLIGSANEKIKKATETARESKEIFTDIQSRIEETAKIMHEISSTAIEQQSGVDQINKAVSDMDMATQQNAALVEESTAATEALLAQADDLSEVMSFFKTENTNDNLDDKKDSENHSEHRGKKEDKSHTVKVSKAKNAPNKEYNHNVDGGRGKYEVNNAPKNIKGEFGEKSMGKSSITDDGFESF